ncbi:MAG: hypothetical protein JSS89_10825, partial [Bacteroidetes bacterium]|nr:hypothetical protein [Bacteroidota bacterium]
MLVIARHTLDAQHLKVGSGVVMMLCKDGNLYSWGYNGKGGLGDGTTQPRTSPVRALLPDSTTIQSIESNDVSRFAVTTEGDVYFWGANDQNIIGAPSMGYIQSTPIRLPYFQNVHQVACGESMCYFRRCPKAS